MSEPIHLSTEVSSERIGAASPVPPPSQEPSSSAIPPISDHLKPLVNPMQTDAPPPSSTIVEPPRSPQPPIVKSDPISSALAVEVPTTTSVANGNEDIIMGEGSSTLAPAPAPESAAAPTAFELEVNTDDQPPLPIDAPVPPSPPAPKDEVPPTLPLDAIPPAVSTPTVITVGEPEPTPVEDIVQQPILDATPPVPSVDATSMPAPAPQETTLPVPASDAMDVDAAAEASGAALTEVAPAPPLQESTSSGSLKRAGDELDAGREEKRVKEDTEIKPEESQAAAAQPPTQPAAPTGLMPGPWDTYQPPAPKPAGPETPLTITQHRHFLGVLRSMKKQKEYATFAAPVDVVLFNIPHYYTIINKPMDLGTIETKMIVSDPRGMPKDKSKTKNWDESKGSYGSVAEATADVRQVWENTRKFNGREHVVSQAADKLENMWEGALNRMPAEPAPAPVAAAPAPMASPAAAAGPSQTPHPRRASVSQPPIIRRTSDSTDRPKREIHPPPSKELPYSDIQRKPKRRNDSQVRWAERILKQMEQKQYNMVSPFLYSVAEIIKALPDYAKWIKHPMDLLIVKEKFAESIYEDVQQVDKDIKLIVANAMRYNPAGDPVHTAALQFEQAWKEKWKELPPKEVPREESEDPLAVEWQEEDDEDEATISQLQKQINDLQKRIDDIREKKASRKGGSKSKSTAAGGSSSKKARKQSVSKASPGINGNGNGNHHSQPKKPRKSKDYNMDVEDDESDEEGGGGATTTMTLTQKQELAEKIQVTDGETLQKAIEIIQQSMNLGSNEEIELDIDALPPHTVVKLYNLVCRQGRARRPKGQTALGQQKKPGRKGTGGFGRKSMNEQEEAARIKRMEAQLQSFDSRPQYEESDESSEEEDSDEE